MVDIQSRQVVKEYKEANDSISFKSELGLEDYMGLKDDVNRIITALSELSESVSSLSPLSGTGSPEGVVTSNLSQVYYDLTNAPTNVTMYFNENVGVDTGWLQVV